MSGPAQGVETGSLSTYCVPGPAQGLETGLLSTYCVPGPAQGVDSLLLTGASEKQRPELNQKPAS